MAHAASTYLGEQRRRSTRVDQTLPLTIRGVDLLGQPFEERTATQTVGLHGCRYASKHHLPKNTWVTLEVPSSHRQKEPQCTRARVVWIQRPRTLRELFQVGVELETGANIWGVAPPPQDWTPSPKEGMEVVTGNSSAHSQGTGSRTKDVMEAEQPQVDSLGVHLEELLAKAAGQPSFGYSEEEPQSTEIDSDPFPREFRDQFESQKVKVMEEARAAAEKLLEERTNALHSDLQDKLNKENLAVAEAFREKWREEFTSRQADAREQISAELTQTVGEQIVRGHEEFRQDLETEWDRRTGRLREEMSEASLAAVSQSEQRLDEKMSKQLAELRSELISRVVVRGPTGREEGGTETLESLREQLREATDTARGQWNELLESSLDSAAQRLSGRLMNGSQEILQAAEQKLAARVAELQEDAGLSCEAARAALDDVKTSLGEEVARAKTSLTEIEEAATHFSEYSRQLDAASQDSLTELRQRLEATVTSQALELERRAAELQRQSMERAGLQLEEKRSSEVTRTTEEIRGKIAPVLERAAEAARQLSASEQEAGETLHIHRERLRQVSEHVQREATEHMSIVLGKLREDCETTRQDASVKWAAEIDASSMRALEQASQAVAKSCEGQAQARVLQFGAQIQESMNRAGTSLEELAARTAEKFLTQIEEIDTVQLDAFSKLLEAAAQERASAAKNQYEAAAGAVAKSFGEVIQAAAEDAVQHAATETNAKVEQERAKLEETAKKILSNLQGQARDEFEHFQQELRTELDESRMQAGESFMAQLDTTLDALRQQGDAQLEKWSAKQEGMGAEAFERHKERLRFAGDSWLDATVRQLDTLNQKRMDSVVHGAEDAIRRACVDVFEGLAKGIKEKFAGGASESESSAVPPAHEGNNAERRASA